MPQKFPEAGEYLDNVNVFGPGAWESFRQNQSPQEMQRTKSYLDNVSQDIEPHGAGGYFGEIPEGTPEISAPPEYLDESWTGMMSATGKVSPVEGNEMWKNWLDNRRRIKKQNWDELTRTKKFMDLVSYVPDLFEGPGMMAGSMLLGTKAQRGAATQALKAFKKAKLPGEAGRGRFIKNLLDELRLGAVFGSTPRSPIARATFSPDLPISDVLEVPTTRLSKNVAMMEKAAYKRAYPDLEAATLFEREAAETTAEIAQREKHIPRLERHRKRQLEQTEIAGMRSEAITPEIATRASAGPGSTAHELVHAGEDVFAGGSNLPSSDKLSKAMQKRGWPEGYSDEPQEQLARLVQDIMEGNEQGIQKALSAEELQQIGKEMGLDLNKLWGTLR